MNITKQIIIFFTIALICVLLSSVGLYLLNEVVGKYYAGLAIFIIPLITLGTIIFYSLKKEKVKK